MSHEKKKQKKNESNKNKKRKVEGASADHSSSMSAATALREQQLYIQPLRDGDPKRVGGSVTLDAEESEGEDWEEEEAPEAVWVEDHLSFDEITKPLRFTVPEVRVDVMQTGARASRSKVTARWSYLQTSLLACMLSFLIPKKLRAPKTHESEVDSQWWIFELMHVCKSWRSVLQSQQRLWSRTSGLVRPLFESARAAYELRVAKLLRCWVPENTLFDEIDLRSYCLYTGTPWDDEGGVHDRRRVLLLFNLSRIFPNTRSVIIENGKDIGLILARLLSFPGQLKCEHLRIMPDDDWVASLAPGMDATPYLFDDVNLNLVNHLAIDSRFKMVPDDWTKIRHFLTKQLQRVSITIGFRFEPDDARSRGFHDDFIMKQPTLATIQRYELFIEAGFKTLRRQYTLKEWRPRMIELLAECGFPYTKDEVSRGRCTNLSNHTFEYTIHFSKKAFE